MFADVMRSSLDVQKREGFVEDGEFVETTQRVVRKSGLAMHTHPSQPSHEADRKNVKFALCEILQNARDFVKPARDQSIETTTRLALDHNMDSPNTPMVYVSQDKTHIAWGCRNPAGSGEAFLSVTFAPTSIAIDQIGRPLSTEILGTGTDGKGLYNSEGDAGGFGFGSKDALQKLLGYSGVGVRYEFDSFDGNKTYEWTFKLGDPPRRVEGSLSTEKVVLATLRPGAPKGSGARYALPHMRTLISFPEDVSEFMHAEMVATICRNRSLMFKKSSRDAALKGSRGTAKMVHAHARGGWYAAETYIPIVPSLAGVQVELPFEERSGLVDIAGIFYKTAVSDRGYVIEVSGNGMRDERKLASLSGREYREYHDANPELYTGPDRNVNAHALKVYGGRQLVRFLFENKVAVMTLFRPLVDTDAESMFFRIEKGEMLEDDEFVEHVEHMRVSDFVNDLMRYHPAEIMEVLVAARLMQVNKSMTLTAALATAAESVNGSDRRVRLAISRDSLSDQKAHFMARFTGQELLFLKRGQVHPCFDFFFSNSLCDTSTLPPVALKAVNTALSNGTFDDFPVKLARSELWTFLAQNLVMHSAVVYVIAEDEPGAFSFSASSMGTPYFFLLPEKTLSATLAMIIRLAPMNMDKQRTIFFMKFMQLVAGIDDLLDDGAKLERLRFIVDRVRAEIEAEEKELRQKLEQDRERARLQEEIRSLQQEREQSKSARDRKRLEGEIQRTMEEARRATEGAKRQKLDGGGGSSSDARASGPRSVATAPLHVVGGEGGTQDESEEHLDDPPASGDLPQVYNRELGVYHSSLSAPPTAREASEAIARIEWVKTELGQAGVSLDGALLFAAFGPNGKWFGLNQGGVCLLNVSKLKTRAAVLATAIHEIAHQRRGPHDYLFLNAMHENNVKVFESMLAERKKM